MERSIEQQYADFLRGDEDNSPLATDGYKFAMAQAGYPLRREEFYLHFRKGGAQFLPFDFKAVTEALRPRHPNSREQGFLLANGYGMTPAMEAALDGPLGMFCQQAGTWANENEPLLTPHGPSFLVSWLEPLTIAFNFPMQVATAIHDGERQFRATCQDEAQIIRLVYEAMGDYLPADETREPLRIEVCEAEYRQAVRDRISLLRTALDGDINRAFEVGMRGMTCMAQHRIVLEECKAAGIQRTSNVKLAYDLYMIPVGTTGHEHQERHGQDINGFRAIRDCRPEPPSYLFDTYDPIESGIPAAIEVMLEDRTRRCSVRFDSGNQPIQLRKYVAAQREHGLNVFYLFMDGYDDVRTAQMEEVARSLGVNANDRHYGLGGYLSTLAAITPLTRDRLAMVYKLCQTGGPGYDGKTGCRNVRKYSGSKGKASIAGRPRLYIGGDGTRYIIQEGEGFDPPSGVWRGHHNERPVRPSVLSPGTEALNAQVQERDFSFSKVAG